MVVEGSGYRPNKGERVSINVQESFQENSEILKGKLEINKVDFILDFLS